MSDYNSRKVLANNLKALLAERRIRQSELCNTLGIAPTTFSEWINAKSYPRMSKIAILADYFDIRASQLIEPPDSFRMGEYDGLERPSGAVIPVLGKVAAGPLSAAVEDVVGWEQYGERDGNGEYFALQVGGSSMEPRMFMGDTVIVHRQSDVDNGQLAVILTGEGDATLKRVLKQAKGLFLMPLNPDYEPIFFSWEEVAELPVTILGRVVELRARF